MPKLADPVETALVEDLKEREQHFRSAIDEQLLSQPGAVISIPGRLSDKSMQDLMAAWKDARRDLGRLMVLPPDAHLNQTYTAPASPTTHRAEVVRSATKTVDDSKRAIELANRTLDRLHQKLDENDRVLEEHERRQERLRQLFSAPWRPLVRLLRRPKPPPDPNDPNVKYAGREGLHRYIRELQDRMKMYEEIRNG